MAPRQAAAAAASVFSEELAARRQPLLRNLNGTLRFDVVHVEDSAYWYVTIARGDVVVTREAATNTHTRVTS